MERGFSYDLFMEMIESVRFFGVMRALTLIVGYFDCKQRRDAYLMKLFFTSLSE